MSSLNQNPLDELYCQYCYWHDEKIWLYKSGRKKLSFMMLEQKKKV